jgi:ubiquinone/menaquinone biosynthesis C-methylase UbiE
MNYSQSEESGLSLLKASDLQVLSVGVSTGGVAEVRMAQSNPKRHIIATTIDEHGVADAKKIIEEKRLSEKIDIRLEDVSEPLPYDDNYFDYIYARLVLHYLPKDKLDKTLLELKRVLKPTGKIFVVVRSIECPDTRSLGAKYDSTTGLTTITSRANPGRPYSRYFHSTDSIKSHMISAGFKIDSVKSYEEQLFIDFMRTQPAPNKDHVIEVIGEK